MDKSIIYKRIDEHFMAINYLRENLIDGIYEAAQICADALKNGKKVFPEELEILINRLDEVEECFVYGLPDAQDSNDVKVSVEVVYNETVTKSKYPNATEQELKDIIWNEIKEINKTLPMYKYIKHLVLTKEPLIKTTTNKIKRNEELKKIIEFGG